MIKVGGKPWRRLVKQGIIAGPAQSQADYYVDDRRPDNVYHSDSTQDTQAVSSSSSSSLPEHKKPLRQRDARVPKKRPRAKQNQIADYTAQCASRTLHKHMDALNQQLETVYEAQGGDPSSKTLSLFEENLKNLILEEMLTGEAKQAPVAIPVSQRYQRSGSRSRPGIRDQVEDQDDDYYANGYAAESVE
jgi:hypothetical protein